MELQIPNLSNISNLENMELEKIEESKEINQFTTDTNNTSSNTSSNTSEILDYNSPLELGEVDERLSKSLNVLEQKGLEKKLNFNSMDELKDITEIVPSKIKEQSKKVIRNYSKKRRIINKK